VNLVEDGVCGKISAGLSHTVPPILPRWFHMKIVIVCPAARKDVSEGEVAIQA
jgi:hypothetical protein